MPATPPQGAATQPQTAQGGRALRAQPTDPDGRSRRQASAGRAGGAESPPAPAIGITRPIKRGRAAASRAAHGGEGGAERKRSEWGRGGEVCGGNYVRHCQGPRQGRRGHMKQPPEVFQRSQARQCRDPYMCIER